MFGETFRSMAEKEKEEQEVPQKIYTNSPKVTEGLYEDCLECDGTGRVGVELNTTCPRCQGTGQRN